MSKYADELADCGVRRINVSLDTLDPEKFQQITRWGDLSKVMEGIDAAQTAGMQVKINAVALKGFNDTEIPDMMRWAHGRGMDLTLIETMPMGEIDEDRTDHYLPLVGAARPTRRAVHACPTSPTRPAARRAICRSPKPAAGSA